VVYGYIAEEHFKSLLSSVVGEKITEKMNNGSIKFKFIGEQFEKKKSDSTTLVVEVSSTVIAFSIGIHEITINPIDTNLENKLKVINSLDTSYEELFELGYSSALQCINVEDFKRGDSPNYIVVHAGYRKGLGEL
tara:strand:- start:2968 stop:3372 length:405 start_codon:yes stop_codon:yes gene_type:complete